MCTRPWCTGCLCCNAQNPNAFLVELKDMFDALDPQYILYHTSNVIESIIETLRHHQV